MIRILLADNHSLLHPGIQTIISAADDLVLADEVVNGRELRQICQECAPDLVLFFPNVENSAVTKLVDDIKKQCPSVKLLAMLSDSGEVCLRQLLDHGVDSLILKSDTPDKLLEAMRITAQGRPWFSAALIPELAHLACPVNELTDRELDILRLVAAEKTNAEIALTLNMAERTVRYHLENIYGKLGVKTRVGAVARALKQNLIPE